MLFDKVPGTLPLYEELEKRILEAYPDVAFQVKATEPYPTRWTRHVLVQRRDKIDDELMGWIDESYPFLLNKRRSRHERRS